MTERVKNIDVALICEIWHAYAAAVNAGDLEKWVSLWAVDGIQMAPDEPPRIGTEQIRTAMKPTFDFVIMSNMVINTEEIQIMGDRAYSHGTYTVDMTPRESGETTRYSGKFLDILEKQIDGSWKIIIDCHNYNEPHD